MYDPCNQGGPGVDLNERVPAWETSKVHSHYATLHYEYTTSQRIVIYRLDIGAS